MSQRIHLLVFLILLPVFSGCFQPSTRAPILVDESVPTVEEKPCADLDSNSRMRATVDELDCQVADIHKKIMKDAPKDP